jgi:hypothetical protein
MGNKLQKLNDVARHPKSSTKTLHQGAKGGASRGPHPMKSAGGKLPAKIKGSDA